MELSQDGGLICIADGGANGVVLGVSTADLVSVTKQFNLPPDLSRSRGGLAFSGDDKLLYVYATDSISRAHIATFDTATASLTGSWPTTFSPGPNDLALDRTGAFLFSTAPNDFGGKPIINVYATGRTNSRGPVPVAARSLLNVSTRLRVQTGEDVLIGGFIVQGTEPKKVVIRALGPSLPLSGRLTNPVLSLYDSTGHLMATNDNWNALRQAVLDTSLAPPDEREAVLVASLTAGAYTVIVNGADGSTGVGIVELYDLDSIHSRTANLSTRGRVESGDNVMIGGFIVGGDQTTKVVVRGIGPSLTANGVVNALPDPVLALHDGNGALIVENDDWRSLQEDAITQAGIAPKDDRESAILATLQPGAYTAIVRGKDNGSGVGLVEIYNLDAN